LIFLSPEIRETKLTLRYLITFPILKLKKEGFFTTLPCTEVI